MANTEFFQEYRRIGLVGFGPSRRDIAIKAGINQYRGNENQWLLHHFDPTDERLPRVGSDETPCDVFIGNIYSPTVARQMRQLSRPVIDLLGEYVEGDSLTTTCCFDNARVGQLAGSFFKSKGYRNYGAFMNHNGVREQQLWAGFCDELSGFAESLSMVQWRAKQIVRAAPEDGVDPFHKTSTWLESLPKPVAILLEDDTSATSIVYMAQRLGFRVPEDIAFLGIGDDAMVCESITPPLSSVSLPGKKLGFEAAKLADRILHEGVGPASVRVPPLQVVERRSTSGVYTQDPVVADALVMMHEKAISGITMKEIIEGLPVSERSFYNRFRKEIGRMPKDVLHEIRVGVGKRLLLETDETVLSIALDCGYPDISAFARIFRREVGCTPSEYRKRNREGVN